MEFAWKYVRSICDVCAIFVPYFDDPPIDHDILLDCGELILTTGVLGDYHIEWKLDAAEQSATTVFTSGVTADPGEVQMQHPFSSPQPVQSGTLYPVFKYIYVNGIRYSAYGDDGGTYAPSLLTCLGPYIIDPLNCATTAGSDPVYPYVLEYDNIADVNDDKSRTLNIELLAPTPYLAISFDAEYASERLDIYYCTESNPLGTLVDTFIHGFNEFSTSIYEPVGYPGTRGSEVPRYIRRFSDFQTLKMVSDFSDFTWASGDFIQLIITGSVLDPSNTNTNWTIKFKCLFELDIDCTSDFSTDLHKIVTTPSMNYLGDPSCSYGVTYETAAVLPSYSYATMPFMLKYLSYTNYSAGFSSGSMVTNPIRNYIYWKTVGSSTAVTANSGVGTFEDLDSGETIDVEYDTGDVIFTFSDIDDYNDFTTELSTIYADPDYTTWTGLTDADSRYYAAIRMVYRDAESTGDIFQDYSFWFWIGDTVTLDAINQKVTFTCDTLTNNLAADGTCYTVRADTQTMINNINTTANNTGYYQLPVGVLSTKVRAIRFMYMSWIASYTWSSTNTTISHSIGMQRFLIDNFCDLTTQGFCLGINTSYPTAYFLYRYWDRFTLTDTTDHASRLANWRLERKIGLRTDDCNDYGTTDWEIVYETP
jgi:hypothetical protein